MRAHKSDHGPSGQSLLRMSRPDGFMSTTPGLQLAMGFRHGSHGFFCKIILSEPLLIELEPEINFLQKSCEDSNAVRCISTRPEDSTTNPNLEALHSLQIAQ